MTLMNFIHSSLFYEIAAVLILAGAVGFIGLRLKQPLIVAFIATGILVGPDITGIVQAHSAPIEMFAKLGISLLLFLVGLKLDLTMIRTMGKVALATGLGQVGFTALIGFFICLAFGLGVTPSLYVAVALTFSSTIIIVKLLSDKQEIDSLHGRIALGFLIVQDIFVVLCMIGLSAFGVTGEADSSSSLAADLAIVGLKGAALIAFTLFFIARVATPLMSLVAASPELTVTFAVGWAAAMATLADIMGFSIELGGLLAGVTFASTPFRDSIAARLSPLRDFMLLFFFISLGAQIELGILGAQMLPALVLSVFVLLGNPLIVMAIMGWMGYRKRTGFMAGLTVAQISEFSLIFIAMGISLGHISGDMLGLVTLVGLITISLSTYMITYSQNLFALLSPYLSRFERRTPHREREESTAKRGRTYDVILFGLGRYGTEIMHDLLDENVTVLGLDFNPDVLRQSKKEETRKGFDVAYGDVSDPNFAVNLPLDKAKWVVCAVPWRNTSLQQSDFRLTLLESLESLGFSGKVALVSHSREEAHFLKSRGADLVLAPFADAARHAVADILKG